jgi:hypothetical protein
VCMIIFSCVSYNPVGEILNRLKFLNVCGRCICTDRRAIAEFTYCYFSQWLFFPRVMQIGSLRYTKIYDADALSQFHFTGKNYGLLLVNEARDTRKTK